MIDERYAFLEMEPGGESALVIGSLHPGMAQLLDLIFTRVHLADWDEMRLDRASSMFKKAKLKTSILVSGTPHLPDEQYDLILTLWSQRHLGDANGWTSAFAQALKPRGRLKIIESVKRQALPEQELSAEILDLTLLVDAVLGCDLYPAIESGNCFDLVKSSALRSVRLRTFNAPDLIMEAADWEYEASCMLRNAQLMRTKYKTKLAGDVYRRCMTALKKHAGATLATPPFTLLTGIKSSAARSEKILGTVEPSASLPQIDPITSAEDHIPTEDATTDVASIESDPTQSEPITAPPPKKRASIRKKSVSRSEKSAATSKKYQKLEPMLDLLRSKGVDALRNRELLAVALWESGLESIADRIVSDYGSNSIASETSPGRLADLLSISLDDACRITAIFALGRRLYKDSVGITPTIKTADDAYQLVKDMGSLRRETLRGLYLNIHNRLICDETISIGTLSQALVHPREVLAPALEQSACYIILAHNHPSGNPTPSKRDIEHTQRLVQACEIMGIEMLDHLIIGADEYVSMKKNGFI